MKTAIKFELALLHMIHLLVHADGDVEEQERQVIQLIREEEDISDAVYRTFEVSLSRVSEKVIYERGIALLSRCTEEEKLRVFVHLYRLAQADDDLSMKEVRLLFYALRDSKINFDDVVLSARMAS